MCGVFFIWLHFIRREVDAASTIERVPTIVHIELAVVIHNPVRHVCLSIISYISN